MEHVWTGYCGSDAHWISCVCNDTGMTGSLVGVVYYVNLPMSSTSASAQCLLSPETRAEVTRASTVSSQPLLYSAVQYSTVRPAPHCTLYRLLAASVCPQPRNRQHRTPVPDHSEPRATCELLSSENVTFLTAGKYEVGNSSSSNSTFLSSCKM